MWGILATRQLDYKLCILCRIKTLLAISCPRYAQENAAVLLLFGYYTCRRNCSERMCIDQVVVFEEYVN